jgi:holin-like protein
MAVSLLVLCLFQFAGETLVTVLSLPFPGAVLGMLALAAALGQGWIKPGTIQPGAGVLLRHLALLFVPAGVGLMTYFQRLAPVWPILALALVLSTFAVLLVVGRVAQALEKQ